MIAQKQQTIPFEKYRTLTWWQITLKVADATLWVLGVVWVLQHLGML